MPVPGLSAEKCQQRNKIQALRYGVDTAPIALAAAFPEFGQPGGPKSVKGRLPKNDEEIMALINLAQPEGAEPLTRDQVHVVRLEIGNNRFIGDRYMHLGESTLKNVARDAAEGFAFMNSHRTGDLSSPAELPYGKTIAGQFQKFAAGTVDIPGFPADKEFQRTVIDAYMLAGALPNGAGAPSTDDLYAGIQAGTIFDVSMRVNGGDAFCDICGNELRSKDCIHAPGTTHNMSSEDQERQKARGVRRGRASFTLEDGHAGEVSPVYDGAVPGSGIRKTLSLAKRHALSSNELDEALEAFQSILSKGDLLMDNTTSGVLDRLAQGIAGRLSGRGRLSAEMLEDDDEEELAPLQPQPIRPSAETLAMRAKLEELSRKDRLNTARDIVEPLIVEQHRLMPAQRQDAVNLMQQLMADDEQHAIELSYTQADGQEVKLSRVEALQHLLGNMPQHDLLKVGKVENLQPNAILLASATSAAEDDSHREEARKFADSRNKATTRPGHVTRPR